MKHLIINADDFGYSQIFNSEILSLAERHLISSTTVMVNRITAEQIKQVEQLKELAEIKTVSVGLHLEFAQGDFQAQIQQQYQQFVKIFNAPPSHLDIHKGTQIESAYPEILKFCLAHNLPCRNHGYKLNGVVQTKNEVINGTKLDFVALRNILENLNDNESYEILFHPGYYDRDCPSSLNKERELDVRKIEQLNPFLKINEIELINYIDLKQRQDKV